MTSTESQRVVLVQCCHLPQFFYTARSLQDRHPEWRLEALVVDHPHVRHCLERLPSFEAVHFLGQPLESLGRPDKLVLPLLNRGYRRIKRAARRHGSPCFESDYQGNLRPLEASRLRYSLLRALHPVPREFLPFFDTFPHPSLSRRILILESCHRSLVERSRRRWGRLIAADAEVVRVPAGSKRAMWRLARSRDFNGAVVFFSGEKGFLFMKVIPFLLRIPAILVVNENGHCFYSGPRSLAKFVADRLSHGVTAPRPSPRILFLQTETPLQVTHALDRLKQDHLYPRSEIVLACSRAHAKELASHRAADRVLSPGGRLRDRLKCLGEIWKSDPDVLCCVLAGRGHFKRFKLLFFLLPVRRRLVFNAGLDCYELRLSNLHWLFRTEPLLLDDSDARDTPRLLLIQSGAEEEILETLDLVQEPKVLGPARISVLCSRDSRARFEAHPRVDTVLSWKRGLCLHNLKLLRDLLGNDADVVAARFSGGSAFWKQKLLFLLLPAPSRLVINENLDCYFLNRANLLWLAPRRPELRLGWGPWRQLLKALLFLPRFCHLLLWSTGMKLRRAYRMQIRTRRDRARSAGAPVSTPRP